MDDDRIVISSGIVLTPESVTNHNFASRFRGYDHGEVRSFLKRIADELAAAAGREAELRQSLQEALARAAHPHLDEETLTAALGEHAARLLTSAREAASSIVSEAETRAARIIGEAEGRIARVRAEADSLLARRSEEAERMTAGLRQAADADVRALRERARAEAEAEVESARTQGREMVGEARSVRERMLADLTRRRRTAEVQIEQLRLARQRLLEAYSVVRRTLDEATTELNAADAEAGPVLEAAAGAGGTSEDLLHPSSTGGSTAARPDPPARPPVNRPVVAAPPAQEMAGPLVRELARSGDAGPRSAPTANPALSVLLSAAGSSATDRPAATTDRRTATDVPAAEKPAQDMADPAIVTARRASDRATISAERATATHPTAASSAAPPPSVDHGDERREGRLLDTAASQPGRANVDELFARMRAAQVPAPSPASAPSPLPAATASPSPATATAPCAATAPVDAGETISGAPQAGASDEWPGPVAQESALSRRDQLLEPVEADLTRQLKRVLQDEQNEVLDALRRQRRPTAVTVLPAVADQTGRVQQVATPLLLRAAHQGTAFASEAETDATDSASWAPEQWAAELAAELVLPLRERLERAIEDSGDGDGEAERAPVGERLGASYRQWKTAQVEEAARHHAMAAFCRGAFAATPDGAERCWVVDDDGPCPDCDDNALAGAVTKGEPFPTGQSHPPAHPGCRCLLAPLAR